MADHHEVDVSNLVFGKGGWGFGGLDPPEYSQGRPAQPVFRSPSLASICVRMDGRTDGPLCPNAQS